jgi:rubrerythrin
MSAALVFYRLSAIGCQGFPVAFFLLPNFFSSPFFVTNPSLKRISSNSVYSQPQSQYRLAYGRVLLLTGKSAGIHSFKGLNLKRKDWKMQETIKIVKASFRMEMMGAGLYQTLAKQCRGRDSALSRRLHHFSEQEAMHGRLFKEYARDQFGRRLRSGVFWRMAGRLMAVLMRPVSLERKLKKLQGIEQAAVEHIEAILAGEGQSGYRQIIQTILPHEKAHAALYAQVFPPRPAA